MIELHSNKQPGAAHEAEPRRSPLWLARPRTAIRLAVMFASVAAVGVFIRWVHQDPPLPSQVATQLQVVAQVGLAEHATVTATCTQTDDHDYMCRLRDSAGRYGYANVSYVVTTHREHTVSWDFPVAADGTVTKSFAAPWDVRTSVYKSLTESGEALGRPDLVDAIACVPALPDQSPAVGADNSQHPVRADATQCDYRCTAHAPVLAVTLSHRDGGHYDLTYRVVVR